jgi:membrane protein implicated in regulation of membrane protease activity
MVEFLQTAPFWYWFVLAVALLIVEISTGTTYFLWPAAAAFITGFADIFPLDGAWRAQLLLFAVITIALTIFATPRVKPLLTRGQVDHHTLNERGAQKIGKRARVEEGFLAGEGKVRFGDTVWLARGEAGENFEAGANVEIVRVDGALLVVKAA